jgi:NAD(P)-dependent dehydrogenase (short-subunit alcohol dehydrogenase family)
MENAMNHPALQPGRAAVVTGGADGIGFAAAQRFLALGMRVMIADVDADRLADCSAQCPELHTVVCDVSSRESVEALQAAAARELGGVNVLMNNAGTGKSCTSLDGYDAWRQTIEVNLWGVIHGVQAFVPDMVASAEAGLVINTGSKQGITSPPGNPAYNASKAAIKSITESLQHDLRNMDGCRVTAHLLVPGFTYTGMIRQFLPEKPEGAWWPEQVVDYLCAALERGDFYIICPDNDVTPQMDARRMAWAMQDLIENRPPLSRWHPDFEAAFAAFMSAKETP